MSKVNKIANAQPFILAVSGGVDSVVLLDKMRRKYQNVVVAHFEHGIRGADSLVDAEFVRSLAQKYHLPYEFASGNLGLDASEDEARQARYKFLRKVTKERRGLLCTGHHADDVIESIVINLRRGTGWRGLAVMGAPDIYRPLLNLSKSQILDYAKERGLSWREDASNQQMLYLRNRVRQQNQKMSPFAKEMLYELFTRQTALRGAIDQILSRMLNPSGKYKRYNFIMADDSLGREILAFVVKEHASLSLLGAQLERALIAIKTAKPSETHQLAGGVSLKFSSAFFVVKTDKK